MAWTVINWRAALDDAVNRIDRGRGAGGWEFFQSSTELGPVMKTRIAEKGFFLFRVNEDQTGGVELTDPPVPFAERGPKREEMTLALVYSSSQPSTRAAVLNVRQA
jgi:hypothetical protein